jgi:hypothetical protein
LAFGPYGSLALRVGTRLGKLSIVGRRGRAAHDVEWWYRVRCDCGRELDVAGAELRSLQVASCGCCDRGREQAVLEVAQRLGIAVELARRYLTDRRRRAVDPGDLRRG